LSIAAFSVMVLQFEAHGSNCAAAPCANVE
jgi:hypothetical protein